MGETADELRQGIDQTRANAAQKIDQIQAKVEGATNQVMETVDDAKQQVKAAFDLRKQIEDKPLVALGAALAGGFILGGLLGGEDHDQQAYARHGGYGGYQLPTSYPRQSSNGIMEHVRKMAKSSGLEETFHSMVDSVMGSVTAQIKTIGEQAIPAFKQASSGQSARGSDGNRSDRMMESEPKWSSDRSYSASASAGTDAAESPAGASF